MEDLCNKNRQDGKQVFQFSTKMRLFVILLDVIKTKSPLATSAILWSAKVNNTGFFFFVLWLQCSFLVVFVFGVTVVVCRSISSLCVKKWSISVTFYGGGGGKAKDPCEYLRAWGTLCNFSSLQVPNEDPIKGFLNRWRRNSDQWNWTMKRLFHYKEP